MTVSEYFTKQTVFLQLEASEKKAALRQMLEALATSGGVKAGDTDFFLRKFMDREKLGSTGIGRGMAIPHVKSDRLAKAPIIAIGVSEVGIDFNAIDAEPVHTVFMILSPKDQAEAHLEILRGISGLARGRDFFRHIRRVKTSEEMRVLIEDLEADQ